MLRIGYEVSDIIELCKLVLKTVFVQMNEIMALLIEI